MTPHRSPARRLASIGQSPIRQISDHAPADAIPLGLGAPTWNMPEVARQALAETAGPCPYGPNAGQPELREAIAGLYGISEEDVVATVGSEEALFSLFMAWLDPGDEVLVPDPGFPAYPSLAHLAGATTVSFALRPQARFRLEADVFCEALDAHKAVRVAVINHPSNPTGGGCDREALLEVASACAARDVLLVSDEVYRDLYFGERPPSLLDVSSDGVVVSSVSKGWGAPGVRLGWFAGGRRWIEPATHVHSYAVTSAAGPSQSAALALLRHSDTVLPAARGEVRTRWEALKAALREHLGIEAEPPAGTFYYWLALPPGAGSDGFAFCEKLRDEARVVIIPGSAFGPNGDRYARISFAATPGQISEGIRRLAPYWR